MFVARRECVAAGSRDVDIVAGAVVALYLPAIGDVGHQAVGIVEIADVGRRNGQRFVFGGGQAADHQPPRGIDIAGLADRVDLIGELDARSEEHTSELQSLMRISYAVFCLKKKNSNTLAVEQ